MNRIPALTGLLAGAALAFAAAAEPAKFGVDDLVRIANVDGLDLSPDGEYVVYSVGEPNFEEDVAQYDLWRVRWDGSERRALTRTPVADEYQAAYSPDGRWIAFLSDRGGEDAMTQVWVMPADGGEAEVSTAFPGGVSDFDWSPDSRRLAVIAHDPDRPEGEEAPKQPEPIVIDRLTVQGGLRGLADGQAPAPLPVRDCRRRRRHSSPRATTTNTSRPGRRTARASPTSPSAASIPIATSIGTSTS